MKVSKFKIGDRVKITNSTANHGHEVVGEVGTIIHLDEDGDEIVELDNESAHYGKTYIIDNVSGDSIELLDAETEILKEDLQSNYIEDLAKQLSDLGCYDIKFEKDSKFHKDFTEWSREVVSPIQIKLDNPLSNYLVTGAKLRGINVEVIDRELLKESEKVVVNGIGRDNRGDLVATIEPKEELYKITFVHRDTELPFVGKGYPRLEEKDVFITSPDGHQSVVDRSKFQFFTIEPYIMD